MARKSFGGADFLNATLEDDNISVVETSPVSLQLRAQDRNLYSQRLDAQTVANTVFVGTLEKGGVRKGSVSVTDGTYTATDNGAGSLSGTGIDAGTINYTTGVVSITFTNVVSNPQLVVCTWKSMRSAAGGEFVSGVATLPEWRGEGIIELFGFEPNELHHYVSVAKNDVPLTSVVYRLSVDGGTNFLFWNGSTWGTPVSDQDWNDWVTVDRELGNIAFSSAYGYKSLTIRVKLIPTTYPYDPLDEYAVYLAPQLLQLNIYHELSYEFFEDAMRSFKRYVDSNYRVLTKQIVVLPDAEDEIRLDVGAGQTAPISAANKKSVAFSAPTEGYKVYNLTADPGRTTPLAHTFSDNNLITLTTPVSGVSSVEVQFFATVPCYISADEQIEVSTSRAVLIFGDDSETNAIHRSRPIYEEIEPDFSNRQVRKRIPTQLQDFTLTFMFQADNRREVDAMVSAFQRTIETSRTITSVATGQLLSVIDTGDIRDATVESVGLKVRTFSLDIRGKIFYPGYITESTVSEVNIPLGNSYAPYFTFSNIVITEANATLFDGANAAMAFIMNAPAIVVTDRNGLRAGVYSTLAAAYASLNTNGGQIDLGPGIYTFDSAITVTKDNVVISGCGKDTILRNVSSGSIGLFEVEANSFEIRDLRIQVNTWVNSQVVVETTGDRIKFDNVLFDVVTDLGNNSTPMKLIKFNAGIRRVVQDCVFYPNRGILCIESTYGNGTRISQCDFRTDTDGGIGGGLGLQPGAYGTIEFTPRECYQVLQVTGDEWFSFTDNRIYGLGILDTAEMVKCIDIAMDSSTPENTENGHYNISDNVIEGVVCPNIIHIHGGQYFRIQGNLIGWTGGAISEDEDACIILDSEDGTGSPTTSLAVGVLISGNDIHNVATGNANIIYLKRAIKATIDGNTFNICTMKDMIRVKVDNCAVVQVTNNYFDGDDANTRWGVFFDTANTIPTIKQLHIAGNTGEGLLFGIAAANTAIAAASAYSFGQPIYRPSQGGLFGSLTSAGQPIVDSTGGTWKNSGGTNASTLTNAVVPPITTNATVDNALAAIASRINKLTQGAGPYSTALTDLSTGSTTTPNTITFSASPTLSLSEMADALAKIAAKINEWVSSTTIHKTGDTSAISSLSVVNNGTPSATSTLTSVASGSLDVDGRNNIATIVVILNLMLSSTKPDSNFLATTSAGLVS